MKKETVLKIINVVLILAMFAASIILWAQLPGSIPTHRNFQWQIDGYMPKRPWALMMPMIASWLFLLFTFLPYLDPKKENYEKFKWIWASFQTMMIWFFAYIHGLTFISIFFNDVDVWKCMAVGIWVLLIIIWNYLWKIRQNWFMWIKTPRTLSSEEVWNKTHRLGGRLFVLAGILMALNSLLNINSVAVLIVSLICAVIIPIVYSYVIFKKKK